MSDLRKRSRENGLTRSESEYCVIPFTGNSSSLRECGYAIRGGPADAQVKCKEFKVSDFDYSSCTNCSLELYQHRLKDLYDAPGSVANGNDSKRTLHPIANCKRNLFSLLREMKARGYFGNFNFQKIKYLWAVIRDLKPLPGSLFLLVQETSSKISPLLRKLIDCEYCRESRDCDICKLSILQLHTLLDELYVELFISDVDFLCSILRNNQLHSRSEYAGIPPPHLYLSCLHHKMIDPLVCSLELYLQLRVQEGKGALKIKELFTSSLRLEGVTPGENETMRGVDPLASTSIRKYWDVSRDRIAAWSSFACPSNDSLCRILEFSGIIQQCSVNDLEKEEARYILEVGCGTGYWVSLLNSTARRIGKENAISPNSHKYQLASKVWKVSGSDKRPAHVRLRGSDLVLSDTHSSTFNEYHGNLPSWITVNKSDFNDGPPTTMFKNTTLLLCYPPPSSSMAKDSVKWFTYHGGSSLVVIGETRGDTGSKRFENMLFNSTISDDGAWVFHDSFPLPRWGNTCSYVSTWRRVADMKCRNLAVTVKRSPIVCAGCSSFIFPGSLDSSGKSIKFFRDRLTRTVFVCSRRCTESASTFVTLRSHLDSFLLPDLDHYSLDNRQLWKVQD